MADVILVTLLVTITLAKPSILCEADYMQKRKLTVIKWLGTKPAVGVCTDCSREFSVPLASLAKIADATESLRVQFAKHRCKRQDTAQDG